MRMLEQWARLSLYRLVVFLFSPSPQERPVSVSYEFQRILIVRQHDQLGDLLIATPAIRAVRKRFPKAHVAVVVKEYTEPMIRNNPYVDEIIVFREKLRRWNLGVFRSLMRSLRGRNGFDCAVVLNTVSRSFSSDCIALLSKAPTIVGPNHLHYPFDSVERIYTVLAKRSPEDRTEIERNLEIVKAIGAESDGYEYDLHLTTEEQAEGRRVFNELFPKKQRPVVCVHFGAENPERVFPLEKLAAVIERLVNDFDVEIVLLVGPHEQARKVILLQQLTVHVKVAPLMPLRTAAAFIGLCELFICNDTGTLHIASSQRVPTVSFHSRNDPALWKPPHQRHIALRAFDHLITSITVDETMQACKGALESYGTKEVIPIVE